MTSTAQTWLFVAVAGAAGTLLRYAVGGWLAQSLGGVFPWETFVINVSGSFAIGALVAAVDGGARLSPPLRMAIMVGFLGGFTTFSSFALETFRLAQSAQRAGAALYLILTNASGFAAVWAGYQLTLWLSSGRATS